MTTLENNTPAGRELDLQVHVAVFGYPAADACLEFPMSALLDENNSTGLKEAMNYVRHYSTDLSAAGLVLERMRKLGWLGRVMQTWRAYEADFENDDMAMHDEACLVLAKTAAEAICRSALQAIEVMKRQPTPNAVETQED